MVKLMGPSKFRNILTFLESESISGFYVQYVQWVVNQETFLLPKNERTRLAPQRNLIMIAV